MAATEAMSVLVMFTFYAAALVVLWYRCHLRGKIIEELKRIIRVQNEQYERLTEFKKSALVEARAETMRYEALLDEAGIDHGAASKVEEDCG